MFGDRRPRFDDLPRLGWASAVYDETLRLYPPGWLITRKAVADDEVLGHHIPAGSLIVISPFLIHRHPASGPDAELFEPGRFLGRRRRVSPVPTCLSERARGCASAARWRARKGR